MSLRTVKGATAERTRQPLQHALGNAVNARSMAISNPVTSTPATSSSIVPAKRKLDIVDLTAEDSE